jgi:hypothetical protein
MIYITNVYLLFHHTRHADALAPENVHF